MIHVCHKITLSLILSAAVLSHTIKGCEDVKLGEGFYGVCLKGRSCRTSESQIFVSQRGEALIHHLIRNLLQRGRAPLRTLILVDQHWKHTESQDKEKEIWVNCSHHVRLLSPCSAVTYRLLRPHRSRSLSAKQQKQSHKKTPNMVTTRVKCPEMKLTDVDHFSVGCASVGFVTMQAWLSRYSITNTSARLRVAPSFSCL